jgi:hypothetical protein
MVAIQNALRYVGELDLGVKVIVGLVGVASLLIAFNARAKAIIDLPAAVTKHDSTTRLQTQQQIEILQRLDDRDKKRFCIQLAEKNHTDWTHCVEE